MFFYDKESYEQNIKLNYIQSKHNNKLDVFLTFTHLSKNFIEKHKDEIDLKLIAFNDFIPPSVKEYFKEEIDKAFERWFKGSKEEILENMTHQFINGTLPEKTIERIFPLSEEIRKKICLTQKVNENIISKFSEYFNKEPELWTLMLKNRYIDVNTRQKYDKKLSKALNSLIISFLQEKYGLITITAMDEGRLEKMKKKHLDKILYTENVSITLDFFDKYKDEGLISSLILNPDTLNTYIIKERYTDLQKVLSKMKTDTLHHFYTGILSNKNIYELPVNFIYDALKIIKSINPDNIYTDPAVMFLIKNKMENPEFYEHIIKELKKDYRHTRIMQTLFLDMIENIKYSFKPRFFEYLKTDNKKEKINTKDINV